MTETGAVLIVSDHEDWSAGQVVDRLSERGCRYGWIDPSDFPQRLGLAYTPIWTRRLGRQDLDDLTGVETTAHLFQEWVDKQYEVRLTAVGNQLFPVGIFAGSAAAEVDWRSDYDALGYRMVECPDGIEAGVRTYLAVSGLHYGAFDFIVTPAGEWVFLECNGAGQWGWLAEECGLPIAEAIADELMGVDGGR